MSDTLFFIIGGVIGWLIHRIASNDWKWESELWKDLHASCLKDLHKAAEIAQRIERERDEAREALQRITECDMRSARKAQLLARKYKASGGGYRD